ncbi:unnamed protein product [Closterium sp. Yama58-4]|nr:unnamed protein product [Closterium sp. Yama58-4]
MGNEGSQGGVGGKLPSSAVLPGNAMLANEANGAAGADDDGRNDLKKSFNEMHARMMEQVEQKEVLRQRAKHAKEQLRSGEWRKAQDEQANMQRFFGSVDWRWVRAFCEWTCASVQF